jgi:hypothetical protein
MDLVNRLLRLQRKGRPQRTKCPRPTRNFNFNSKNKSAKMELFAYGTSDPKIRGFLSSETATISGNMISRRYLMRPLPRRVTSIIAAAAFFSPVLFPGCAARVSTGYTIHDGYYNDDHVWDADEVGFYSRWEGETHRSHVDFRKRPEPEQKEYFTWRHGQH